MSTFDLCWDVRGSVMATVRMIPTGIEFDPRFAMR